MATSLNALLAVTDRGLWCEAGGFYIDPWQPVDHAVITHAHADHARPGSAHYLCAEPGAAILRHRVGEDAPIDTLPYGEPRVIGEARVTLHPAGHLLGSAQIGLEHRGHVTVITGDFKRQADRTCARFEPIPCHTLIMESTFALPVYRWPDEAAVFDQINAWWRANQQAGRTSLVLAYSLGKAQRLLSGLDPASGPILLHGAVDNVTQHYREAGVVLPPTLRATDETLKRHRGHGVVVAPPSAQGSTWVRRLGSFSAAMASGWMQTRGNRTRRAVDRGFVLSDHADWDGLLQTIRDTQAERIGVTHGYTGPFTRYLTEQGYDSFIVPTRFEGESDADDES